MKSEYLNYKNTALYLGLPIGTLYGLVSKKAIPFARVSKRLILFKITDLENWITQNTVTPQNELKTGGR